ncbi:ComF family protein [Shimia sp. SDUM112013]|uniref:ComF family protein n=1 Tax=Shimia sp. SDUM112013 TaxID=3136160 RepID=UPI0032EFF461
MRNKIQTAIQLIYPPRCIECGGLVESDFGLCGPCWCGTPFIGGLVCDLCGTPLPGTDDGSPVCCDDCMKTERPWQKGRSALLYKDNARKLVLALKHGDRHDIVQPAAKWMMQAARPLLRPNIIVVPVPLHYLRLLKRRYNQSALLAQALARVLSMPWCPDALQRPHTRGSMSGLAFEERYRKMQGSFRPHPRRAHFLAERPVLLIDDVMTSGATLSAATEACFHAKAKEVHILTLARVAKDT